MMEPIETPTMHVNESKALCSPLSCSGRGNDEITKKLEDELLYDAGEDGDEDDALSDDSLRLRLSDDEADPDDNERTSSTSNNQLKSLKTESMATANTSSVDGRLNGINNAHNNLDNQEEKFQSLSDSNTCVTKTEKPDDDDEEGAVVEETKVNNQTEHEVGNNVDLKAEKDQSSLEKVNDSNLDNSLSVNGVSEVNKNTSEDNLKVLLTNLVSSADEQDNETNDDNITSTSASSKTLSSKDSNTVQESNSPVNNCQEVNNCDSITCEEEILEVEEDKHDESHVAEELGDQEVEEEDDIIHIEEAKMETHKATSSESSLEKSKFSVSTTNSIGNNCIDVDDDINDSKIDESSETILTESDKTKNVEDKANNVIAVKSLTKLMSNSEPDTTEPSNKRRLSCSEDSTDSPSKKIFRDNTTSSSTSSSKQQEKEQNDVEDTDIDRSNTNEDIVEIQKNATEVDDVINNDSPQKTPKNGEVLSNLNGNVDSTTQDITNGLETQDDSLVTEMEVNERSSSERQTDVHPKRKLRRKKRRTPSSVAMVVNQGQEKENVRQKRETAQKAQEIIRKYNDESDSESSEQSSLIQYNKPISHNNNNNNNSNNNNARSTSPPALKRNNYFDKEESLNIGAALKKPKRETDYDNKDIKHIIPSEIKTKSLDHVRTFFLRDCKQKLSKFTQEELEELLVQKIVETITMRDEIGKLREQAKISERNQEATRSKCQQLAKHVKDFDMVIKRYETDRKQNEKNDKFIAPIKINRSVGLQVNFVSDHGGLQNLRQLSLSKQSQAPVMNGATTYPIKQNDEPVNNVPNNIGSTVKTMKGIKVRSPRKIEPGSSPVVSTACLMPIQNAIPSQPAQVVIPASALPPQQQQQLQQQHKQQQQQMPIQLQQPVTSVTPAALVVSKQVDTRIPITSSAQIINHQILPNQTITFNGVVTSTQNTINRSAKVLNVRSNNTNTDNTLIDLTGEEEKNKKPPPLAAIAPTPKDPSATIMQKGPPRFQRIVQSAPAMTIGQPTNIKVIQPSERPTPTALVNNMNMNASQQLYVMKKNGTGQQLLIANHQIRPAVTTNARQSFPGIAYSAVPTIGNTQTLRVVTTAPSNIVPTAIKAKHPAPLPAPPVYAMTPGSKLPPPAPSLKISKVQTGIVLSWNMTISDKHAEIASYQLYAYQEVVGTAPSTSMWKKVGDVRALALPMACTLTQFSEGNNYYFAVRAVDTLSRLGQYSQPGSISL